MILAFSRMSLCISKYHDCVLWGMLDLIRVKIELYFLFSLSFEEEYVSLKKNPTKQGMFIGVGQSYIAYIELKQNSVLALKHEI